MSSTVSSDVEVGGGFAGRSTVMFTVRRGLDTFLVDLGASLLRWNIDLDNISGFPADINSRQLLDYLVHCQSDE